MQRMVSISVLLLAGCGGATDPTEQLAIDGDWSLTTNQIASTCPVEGSVFPVAPGLTTIRGSDGAVDLSSAGEVITYAVDGRQWQRSRTVTVGECAGAISETWLLHSAFGRRMSATFSMEVDVRGDCAAYGVQSCRIDYAVWGVQP